MVDSVVFVGELQLVWQEYPYSRLGRIEFLLVVVVVFQLDEI